MSAIQILLRGFILPLFLTSATSTAAGHAQASKVSVRQPHIEFGTVVRGAVLEHVFTLVNESGSPVRIKNVRLTPPLLPSGAPAELPPHQETTIRVKLDTKSLNGDYQGVVLLTFDDASMSDVQLTVVGRVIQPLEVVPLAIFATAQRGEQKQVSVEIVNHEEEPVMLGAPRYSPQHFTTRLETLEQGRRFRLTLTLNPDGPAGKNMETIRLQSSSALVPELVIVAHTYLRERVYTFPDAVELGALRLDDIQRDPKLLNVATQTLMIYRKDTADFQAKVSTDLPELTLRAERGPLGDRYQVTVSLAPDKIRSGTIRGNIFIETNDSKFPKLTVPVSGQIVGPARGGG